MFFPNIYPFLEQIKITGEGREVFTLQELHCMSHYKVKVLSLEQET